MGETAGEGDRQKAIDEAASVLVEYYELTESGADMDAEQLKHSRPEKMSTEQL